jgi:hypothetical protein
MARGKKHTAEQIVNLLRQVEVSFGNGKTLPQACKEAEIVEQTYHRWHKEYGGLKVDQALLQWRVSGSYQIQLGDRRALSRQDTAPIPRQLSPGRFAKVADSTGVRIRDWN